MKYLSEFRSEFDNSILEKEMHQIRENRKLEILQCRSPINEAVGKMLCEHVFSVRDDIELRIYGVHNVTCDLSFLRNIRNVKRLSLDYIDNAIGIEHISALQGLKRLTVGIYRLDSFEFLKTIPDNLEHLYLLGTYSKKPDLNYIARFKGLKKLFIEGHTKGIENIASLVDLEDVTLKSISTLDITYLSTLKKLWSLAIKLGGIRDFAAIEGMGNIKYLELWQIRGLENIAVISSLEGLQNLFLQSLPLVRALPSLAKLKKLRRISLHNMKGLTGFSALEQVRALEEFILTDGMNQKPSQLTPLFSLPNLKSTIAKFGSDKKNMEFENMMSYYGIEELKWTEDCFQYE